MREWRELPGGAAGLAGFVFVCTFAISDGSLASAVAMVALYLAGAAVVFIIVFTALVILERRALWERRLSEGQDANPHAVNYSGIALIAASVGVQLPIGLASFAFLILALASVFMGGFAQWPDCGPGVPGRFC